MVVVEEEQAMVEYLSSSSSSGRAAPPWRGGEECESKRRDASASDSTLASAPTASASTSASDSALASAPTASASASASDLALASAPTASASTSASAPAPALASDLASSLPSVGAFTVQCASCMKWRLIPTKEKYEEIRHSVLEQPFFCSRAAAWRAHASCDEPSDVSQESEHHFWAIDRPNIPVAPRGWERLLVIRAAGASKFADVYYISPTGRKLRSMPQVERFLAEHPEHATGVKLSQFSFIIPRPLDKNYCRKKIAGSSPPDEDDNNEKKASHISNDLKKTHPKKLGVMRKPLKLKGESGKESYNGNILSQTFSKGDAYIGAAPLSQQRALVDTALHVIADKELAVDNNGSASIIHIKDSPS